MCFSHMYSHQNKHSHMWTSSVMVQNVECVYSHGDHLQIFCIYSHVNNDGKVVSKLQTKHTANAHPSLVIPNEHKGDEREEGLKESFKIKHLIRPLYIKQRNFVSSQLLLFLSCLILCHSWTERNKHPKLKCKKVFWKQSLTPSFHPLHPPDHSCVSPSSPGYYWYPDKKNENQHYQ